MGSVQKNASLHATSSKDANLQRNEAELATTKEDLALQVKTLTRLHELSMYLAGPLELGVSLHAILSTFVDLHEADFGLISLYDEDSGYLYDKASVGFKADEVSQVAHLMPRANVGASGSAFATKTRVIVENIEQDERFSSILQEALKIGFRAAHSTPILTRAGQILGVLSAYFKGPRAPNKREMQFADMCARKAAVVIEAHQAQQELLRINNELEERVQERTQQLEKQSHRLRTLADQVLSSEQKERKRIAAILHDHLQQTLVASTFQLAEASRKIKEAQFELANDYLNRGKDCLNEAIRSARSLTVELRPPVLYEDGLLAAFKWLARKFQTEHDFEVELHLKDMELSLSDNLKIMVFESVKELLFNVIKHAQVQKADLYCEILDDLILYVRVEDYGCGFNVQQEEKAFSVEAGGLGLFGIRERLKLLNASFEIISQPQQGTKIEIKIPIQQFIVREEADFNVLHPVAHHDHDHGLFYGSKEAKTISILLVDDHKLVREGIANILQQKDRFHVIAQAEDGLDAIEKTAAFQPDVVIMDVNMPKLNGIEATKVIKKDFPHIHIIGLSVQDENDVADSMKEAGALTLLNKAGDPEQLIDTILRCAQH